MVSLFPSSPSPSPPPSLPLRLPCTSRGNSPLYPCREPAVAGGALREKEEWVGGEGEGRREGDGSNAGTQGRMEGGEGLSRPRGRHGARDRGISRAPDARRQGAPGPVIRARARGPLPGP